MTAVTRTFPLLLLLFALLCQAVQAQPSARAEREIGHLLDHVARSGCQFNRNGQWYAGEAARIHLQKKYDYLDKRALVPDAESFIERAASASSMTGTPYAVRCGSRAPVAAGPWLSAELKRFRASTPVAAQ